MAQEHGFARVEIFGPGGIDDVENVGEVCALDFEMFGFEITALEESTGVLFEEPNEFLP